METVIQTRTVEIPPYRMKMLRTEWMKVYTPIVELGKLQIRMNIRNKCVELRTCEQTEDVAFLDRAAQFIRAILVGFAIEDALAILKFGDVYLSGFEMHEVKTLKNLHVERAIGRIIGREGKTKEAIEGFTNCKTIVKEETIHLLGTLDGVNLAKDAICRLIMGSQPGGIYNRLRIISSRRKDKMGTLQTVYNDLDKRN